MRSFGARNGLPAIPLGDGRKRAVAAAFADSLAVAFRRKQIPVTRQRQAVGAIGLLANEIDLSVGLEAIDPIRPDIREVEAAVRRS